MHNLLLPLIHLLIDNYFDTVYLISDGYFNTFTEGLLWLLSLLPK